jgi:hypothetical protein
VVVLLVLAGLLSVAGCSRQESAWRRSSAEDTVGAYEAYLRDYPAGTHAGEAGARLAELRELQEWARAQRFNTPEAYQRYLSGYPTGRFAQAAREKLSDFLLAPGPGQPAPAPAAAPGEEATPGEAAPPPAVSAGQPGGSLLAAAGAAPTHRVQLGAFGGGEAAARAAWEQLLARHRDLLAGTTPRVDVVERAGRSLWRLQAGPLSATRAREVCDTLKSRGEACLLVRD